MLEMSPAVTIVHIALAAVLWLFSLMRGATPERILATALLLKPPFALIYPHFSSAPLYVYGVEVCCSLADAVILAMILPVALRANRLYPLWLGGMQIVATASHFTRAAFAEFGAPDYLFMDRVPYELQLIGMAVGLYYHVRRSARLGRSYPSWVPAKLDTF